MPAATDKAALLAVTHKEFAKLDALIEPIPAATATAALEDDTTIKDVIGHRAAWIDLFLGWHADGIARREVHMPTKGYKWNQLPSLNAAIRDAQAGLDWAGAKVLLRTNHAKLVALIEDLSDDALYGSPMAGHDKWTTGRFAEASGASHYRSAVKVIRGYLKQLG